MKKFFLSISVLFSFLFFLAVPALAVGQQVGICDKSTDPSCIVANTQVGSILGAVVNFVFVVAVILALGFLVYGGIRWITSGGDKEGVATARGTIIAAIIGLIIIVLSYFILNFILTFLGIQGGLGGVSIPTLATIDEATARENSLSTEGCSFPNGKEPPCGPFSIKNGPDEPTLTNQWICDNQGLINGSDRFDESGQVKKCQ